MSPSPVRWFVFPLLRPTLENAHAREIQPDTVAEQAEFPNSSLVIRLYGRFVHGRRTPNPAIYKTQRLKTSGNDRYLHPGDLRISGGAKTVLLEFGRRLCGLLSFLPG